jgi:predicted kinase
MPTLIITRGLPGAGKSTRARAWVAKDRAGRARVNRDDLRSMLHDGVWTGHDTETQIIGARDVLISSLLRRGLDVVCDDTNLPQRTARDLANVAAACAATLEVWDLTDVPVEVCVERDAARGSRVVGEPVIRDLHRRYLAGKRYPLPIPVPHPAAPAAAPVVVYAPPPGAPTAVMVDIDGTVALMGKRSPYDETQVHLDRPNIAVITAIQAMHAAGHAVVFCSGRTEASRADTEAWLAAHVGVAHHGLYLRPIGDRRKDSVVKREIFDRHIRTAWHVVAVFDDRQQVVDAWRELGLTVFQVAPGDF